MDLSGWIVFAALVAFIVAFMLFIAYSAWRRISTITSAIEAVYFPPRDLVVEVREAIRWTQIEASDNVAFDILPTQYSPEEVLSRLRPELREAQSRPIADAARLTYAIEWNRLGFFHVMSIDALDRPNGDQKNVTVRSALHVATLILTQQLEEAEIELESVEPTEDSETSQAPRPSASDAAPATFALLLDPAQHDAFMMIDPPWPPGIPDR